jgi:type I restriction enzyme S subunit
MATSQDFVNWSCGPTLDYRYLKYALIAEGNALLRFADGSVHQTIYFPEVKALHIATPSRGEQSAIADVLSALDDKIELNRRMNETLEALAQAIFRDWFVDFGPVRRKLEGATDPVAILGDLIPDPARAADVSTLFPDSFGDDDVPQGWEETTLDAVCTVNDESWKSSKHPADVTYVDLSNTKWGVIESTSHFAWTDAPSRARRIAKPGDSIIGTVRPGNGSYAFISDEGYTVSTGFAVLRPKRPEYTSFIYIATTRPENIYRLANLADGHGGAYPAINPSEVVATEVALADESVLLAFDDFAAPIRARIEHNKKENLALAEARNYLLPRLMSGEVRVRGAQKAVS